MLQADPRWHWRSRTTRVVLFPFELDFCLSCTCNYTIVTGSAQEEIFGELLDGGWPESRRASPAFLLFYFSGCPVLVSAFSAETGRGF